MDIRKSKSLLVLILCLFFTLPLNAEPKPRWVRKGVKELNQKRSNESYSFHIFHQEDENKYRYSLDNFTPLLDYIDSIYHVNKAELTVDSIGAQGELPATYMVKFIKDNVPQTVYARLVDHYSKVENYPDNTFDYQFYQLYAISEPGYSQPDFDQFILKRKYGVKPLFMSLIPGLGQIYKGEPAKGYSFLGIEAAMVASIIYSTTQVNHWKHWQDKTGFSYRSKILTFQQWRTFSCIAGGALYIYNLFDAVFAKGARYVEIKRPNSQNVEMTFTPVVLPAYYGMGININF